MSRNQVLIDQIQAAFCDGQSDEPPIWLKHDDLEYNDLRAILEDVPWEAADEKVFLAGAPSALLMDDALLAYYLPAFMIAALRNDDDLVATGLFSRLESGGRRGNELREEIVTWPAVKRKAVAAFLEYASTKLFCIFPKQAKRAMELARRLDIERTD